MTAMPKVRAYPVCSACKTPYVLRRAFVLSPPRASARWIWQRDCKHKAPPEIAGNQPSASRDATKEPNAE